MRTNEQILKVLRKNIVSCKDSLFYGMCEVIHALNMVDDQDDDYITDKEYINIFEYLYKNCPFKNINPSTSFWWTKGDKRPRLKWLDKQLKQLKLERDGKTKKS